MVRVLSIAAALVAAPTAQPQTAGGKATLQAEGRESFATILDAVSGATEHTSTTVVASTQSPAQSSPAAMTRALTLETGDVAVETSDTSLALEQALQGISQPDTTAEAALASAMPAPGAPPQATNVASAVTTPAMAPATAQAAVSTIQAATSAPAIATSINATADGEANGEDAAETADAAADGTIVTQPVTAGVVPTTAPTLPTLAPDQTSDTVLTDVSAESLGAAPAGVTPEPTGDEQSADASKAGPAANTPTAAITTKAADNSVAKATVAPAVDVAAQAPPTQTAASQVNVADALTTPTASGDAAKTQATPAALQSAPSATIQVYSRIIERADGRAQRFEIRLDPAELGRVDVRIEIGADRKVHAVLAAHDSAALTDLMRGQRALERALSDAGIDLADKGVRFELAADGGREGASQRQDGQHNSSQRNTVWRGFDTLTMPADAETAAASQPVRRSQRLDLVA